jgi:hypothetical protein
LPSNTEAASARFVDGTKEESDCDESSHSERSEESAGAYEAGSPRASEDSCSIQIPRFARNDNLFYFHRLTEHIDNTAQAGAKFIKGE